MDKYNMVIHKEFDYTTYMYMKYMYALQNDNEKCFNYTLILTCKYHY